MITREFRKGDEEGLRDLHAAMGMDYKFPTIRKNGSALIQVVEENGKIVAGSFSRVVSETYLWVSPEINPRDKWTAIRLLQVRGLQEAAKRGWEELIAVIPESVEKMFARRLKMLRWDCGRTDWHVWTKEVPQEEVR